MPLRYCFVDEFLKAHPGPCPWRPSNNARPELADAQVLSLALLQGALGLAPLQQTYRLLAHNLRAGLPRLPSSKPWLARLHKGAALMGMLLQKATLPLWDTLYRMESKPIGHGRVALLPDKVGYPQRE